MTPIHSMTSVAKICSILTRMIFQVSTKFEVPPQIKPCLPQY